MKASELRALDDAQLREKLAEYKVELFNLRFQKATGKLTNTARPRQVKKEIARILTILRERELAQAELG
ncbi:MAG: 50S ribosomal protein L29 [Chloroflexus sp.]|uniref:50S ribosomal protein L29 n=1 Tax=unclassified Chloroflexus TaxID=2633855 RepID=UPI00048A65A3|nr:MULTISPECIES: 50S ribosomal protein L29 [unclassified Chloroflexus]MBO9313291.1 50S ribosomal protein L29 [Chloroflexus sp.]MBO9314327.1 50S ribosomal protein L29 [Chloroflexus sp.]MBO9318435.1 50S ribosomal protein L29 [Chloroflexus sp.]MBO9337596.1 50S ribosomal protein L29 [Chloroflexus sp.]MBO9349649.1 50S ribosomal protein L29 [Chloroflexus sp.]